MKHHITTALIAVAAAALTVGLLPARTADHGAPAPAAKESAFDRVMRTGTIRCGYVVTGDAVKKDPVSGEMSGFTVDIVNEMAAQLGLKAEWSDEVGYGDFAEGLKTGRYDAFCGSMVMTSARARVAQFTRPFMAYLTFAYVRADENRFSSYADMNKPEIKAEAIDGEVYQILTQKNFPEATQISLPNMTHSSQMFIDLINKKADIVVHTPLAFIPFDKENPGKLRQAFPKPVGHGPVAFAVGIGENDLKDMMDTALLTMQDSGKIEAILRRHGLDETQAYRMSGLFDVPTVE